jgi:hypothetical protein
MSAITFRLVIPWIMIAIGGLHYFANNGPEASVWIVGAMIYSAVVNKE